MLEEVVMPKFLVQASYTKEGVAGVMGKGGSARRDAVEHMAGELGGRLESFHFGFGEYDAHVIVDLPDNEAAAAVAMTVGASGAAATRIIVLLTPEQVDEAARRSVNYRAPGS